MFKKSIKKPEDEENTKTYNFKFSKKVVAILVILLLCFSFVIVWVNKDNLQPENVVGWVQDKLVGNGKGSGYPKGITGSNVHNNNFRVMDGNIVALSDTSFVILNSSSKEISNRQHSFSTPILKTGGNNALIYNLGGTGLQIETQSKNIYKGTVLNSIISGAIADNGTYGVITESSGYFGEMIIYSKKNVEKYKYNFSEYYVTNISISSDGKTIAVTGLTAENGSIKSIVYIFNTNSEKPVSAFEYNDNMLLDIYCLSNGNLIVIGDGLLSVINPRAKSKTDYDYNGKTLTCFDIDLNKGAAISLASTAESRDCSIITINKDGTVLKTIETDNRISAISYDKDKIAALVLGEVYVYDHWGQQKGKWTIGDDAKQIRLYSKKGAYVLGVSEIRKVQFK